MIFISYYTLGDYEKVFKEKLLPSFVKWNLPYDIEVLDDIKNWQVATHYKAEFCKKMLLKHKQAVLFLDVDVTIEKYPKLIRKLNKYDIALHYLDWYKFWRKVEGQKKREALSGTLYLNYNEKVLQFLDKWIEENNKNTAWEQRNMQWVLRSWKKKLKIYELPAEYCTIILPNGQLPEHYLTGKPVILHHQVSRKLKNAI